MLLSTMKSVIRVGLVCVSCLFAASAAAQTQTPSFVYVLNNNPAGNQVYGFSVNEATGGLTPIAGVNPLATGGNGFGTGLTPPEMLALDSVNNRLYALNGGSRTVSAYAINPANGTLTPLPFSPIDLPSGFTTAGTVMVHPTGSPLLVGNSNGGIASYNITATSATPAAGSPFATPTGNFSSAFSRDGSFFYTGGNDSSGATSGFSVNAATGVLTPLPGSPFATGSNLVGLSTDANGRLFGIEFFGNSPLRAFTASAGVPTAVTGSPFASGLSQGIKTSARVERFEAA